MDETNYFEQFAGDTTEDIEDALLAHRFRYIPTGQIYNSVYNRDTKANGWTPEKWDCFQLLHDEDIEAKPEDIELIYE